MKKLLLLLFSLMLSFNSYGEWSKVFEEQSEVLDWDNGDIAYLDYKLIYVNDENVYWWELKNFGKPTNGYKSEMVYLQGNCVSFRVKILSTNYFLEPMGKGNANSSNSSNSEWNYPLPGTHRKRMIDYVCGVRDLL